MSWLIKAQTNDVYQVALQVAVGTEDVNRAAQIIAEIAPWDALNYIIPQLIQAHPRGSQALMELSRQIRQLIDFQPLSAPQNSNNNDMYNTYNTNEEAPSNEFDNV